MFNSVDKQIMNYIDYVKVEGFWGDKTAEIDFSKDINFIIGVNGSGKLH